MTRYFPEIVEAVKTNLPERCVVDGEIVVVVGQRLEFEVLQQRIHPATSRVNRLAKETPASFIAFDILASGDEDYTTRPFGERRALLEQALQHARPPVHLTPATTDHDLAEQWFGQFEGAGLDGVVAKPLEGTYEPNKRVMFKIKHARTADCVVAGYRVHATDDRSIGSLLLGLYTDSGDLMSVGVIGAFPAARRKELFVEMQPLVTTFDNHPWAWAKEEEGTRTPRNAEGSRWAVGKDLSFTPLRPERVVEVRYEHMEGIRFRHTAQFNRWRPDRDPKSCTYEQLEEPVKFDLADILSLKQL
jgi:ATP-dependent DNA ligase